MWIYQRERFPIFQHGPLILVFTFSAAAFSRLCRGQETFIELMSFAIGAVTTILFFFLLRLFDEFKDFEDDSRYRPYRPVPRGLISFAELRWMVAASIAFITGLNWLLIPSMLVPILLVFAYLALMTKEFYVPEWLKAHPFSYMASHMVIMPLIDIYTTGLDWLNAGLGPPAGVEIFLIVSFFNGMVIEIGRKVRAPEAEETGVETYSALYGPSKAAVYWILVVLATFGTAAYAATKSSQPKLSIVLLMIVLPLTLIPAVRFWRAPRTVLGKQIEMAAGVWTLAMYLILGGTPMAVQLIKRSF